jgi:hypothetical protein
VSGIGKTLHVGPHFRQEHMQDVPAHPCDLAQPFEQRLKRAETLLNLLFHMLDGTIYGLREGQEFTQQKAMMLSQVTDERFYQSLMFVLHALVGSAR